VRIVPTKSDPNEVEGAFRRLRDRLDAAGFHPSSSRGQNFLVDPNLLDAIARDATIARGETVLEIGAGPGWLTARLGSLASRVVSFEIEPKLAALAKESVAALRNVEIVTADALGGRSKHGLHPMIGELLRGGGCVVVANLPYSIAAPLLANLFEHEPPPARAIVLIQREVADRLLAKEGTREYGPLTIAIRARATVARVREVPAQVFRPRPRVASTVVRVAARADPLPKKAGALLPELIAAAFRERRKKLAPQLAPLVGGSAQAERALAALGHRAGVRGESLSVEDFRSLANTISQSI
jgi:16S rRNA (adenine1518-N6/adenine1519-N6)-dimethyltransferase